MHISRPLVEPEDPIILSAGLKILPEIETIEDDGGQSIWVAVEISGDFKMPVRMNDYSEQINLKVAVVVDNS